MRKIIFLLILLFSPIYLFANTQPTKAPCFCDKIPARFATVNSQHAGMVNIPSGSFMMGGDNNQARLDEFPKHPVFISSFWMDITDITNAQFAKFVSATGYITTAEKKPDWAILKKQLPACTPKPDKKMLVPASLVFTPPNYPIYLNDPTRWWSWVPGANWQHPRGPNSNITKLANHPVTQVSWEDATAYCHWMKKRLPTEAEWEWAARGGLYNKIYPWGNEDIDTGKIKANTWQGEFPNKNTLRDQYYYTSPVKTYAPNGYGLYDMAGNVWQWVNDWYSTTYYGSFKNTKAINPRGPAQTVDPDIPTMPEKVLRGGSYLCNATYCAGYRVAARMKASPDTSMEHVGFRCAS